MTRAFAGAAAAFLLGAATVFGFAPFHAFPLPLLTLAALFHLWRTAAPRSAASLGFLFGAGFFLAGVSWVYVSMRVFGAMPAALAALAAALFCCVLALFPALAGFLFARLRSGRAIADALLAAGAWTFSEWLRGWVLTGFPWLALGYSQTPPSPLAGFAPVLGVYGVGFVGALCAALLALSWRVRAQRRLAALAIAVLAGAGYGLTQIAWTEPTGAPITVSLLQGNIEQSLKWRPELVHHSLETYRELARAHPAQLVVLPETAIPLMLDQVPRDYLAALANSGEVLLGTVTTDEHGRHYNSAATVGVAGRQLYSKSHLVPFGEFTPPAFAWTLSLLRIPMSNFAAGGATQPPLAIAGQKVAVNICYEDVFGEEIVRPLPEATLLANLSNTAWFGDSLAQPQHLQIAQMRALETGRPMLRATNTGMTAIVGPRGRVEKVLPPFTRDALTGEVRGYAGATPYVRWGNYAALLLALAGLLAPLAGRFRNRT